jgi:hypothetical protein
MNISLILFGIFFIGLIAWWVISRQRKNAAWEQFASEIGAEYVKGGFLRGSKVQAKIKEWPVTLDTYSVSTGDSSETYTRIKAVFENRDGLQFTLAPKGLIAKLDKVLGTKDIEMGDAEFDGKFVIRGSDSPKLHALFANINIRQMILDQHSIHLRVKGNDLIFDTKGEIKDIERLKTLFELFRQMLEQLKG